MDCNGFGCRNLGIQPPGGCFADREDRAALIGKLAADPVAGDLVPGLGGIRKLRFAPSGRGKSGAFRVVYYFASSDRSILALLIYGKNEQPNITTQ